MAGRGLLVFPSPTLYLLYNRQSSEINGDKRRQRLAALV